MSLPRARRATILLLLASTLAASTAAAQECGEPEPSAVDLAPAAAPLTVSAPAAGQLLLEWEDAGASAYRLYRGRLSSLLETGYDHLVVDTTTETSIAFAPDDRDRYYLLAGACSVGTSSTGRDSHGVERPIGGLVQVVVRLELTGPSVPLSGVGLTLHHPAATTFTEEHLVQGTGPLAPGAPGNPITVVNLGEPGRISVASILLPGDSGSFEAPEDVFSIVFGYHGAAPAPSDLAIDPCDVAEEDGDQAPVTCVIASVTLLS